MKTKSRFFLEKFNLFVWIFHNHLKGGLDMQVKPITHRGSDQQLLMGGGELCPPSQWVIGLKWHTNDTITSV